jgi:putative transposase
VPDPDAAASRINPPISGRFHDHGHRSGRKTLVSGQNHATLLACAAHLGNVCSSVLNRFPKSMAPAVTSDLQDIHHAEAKAAALAAIKVFTEKYGVKYAPAVACQTKDAEALLTFFDCPAEHWDHLRTSNPVESVFATVRHRSVRTKGALSQKTVKLMVFTLICAASQKWRRLNGANQLPRVIEGVKFTNGVANSNPVKTSAA